MKFTIIYTQVIYNFYLHNIMYNMFVYIFEYSERFENRDRVYTSENNWSTNE